MAGEIETKKILETNAKDAPVKDILWEASQMGAESQTHLEDDPGTGGAAIIRVFEFHANPEAFKQHKPTKQELFNSHYKYIETFLWKDGLKVMPDVNPQISINKKKTKYRIIVGAQPMKGQLLSEQPKLLHQLTKR